MAYVSLNILSALPPEVLPDLVYTTNYVTKVFTNPITVTSGILLNNNNGLVNNCWVKVDSVWKPAIISL